MGNSIKPHIETAEKTGVCNLSKLGLTEFPAALLQLGRSLRTLDVSQNKFSRLPDAIGGFVTLKNLHLSSNRLVSLPEEIGRLVKLELLHVDNNQLRSLPSSLANLRNLREVKASHNLIKTFPLQLGNIASLDSVDLCHNQINEVPDGVQDINAVEINLNQNQISKLSESVADCPRLKVLRLEENCLQQSSVTPRILKQSSISLLTIEGNVFDAKAFRELDGYEEYMERFTASKKKMT